MFNMLLKNSELNSDPFQEFHEGKIQEHEYRIYGNAKASIWAIVDEEDYAFFMRWRWCPKSCKRGKVYLRRAIGENLNGVRLRTSSVYLHVEIMKRTGIEIPCPQHKLVDHLNGNSLDCRRINLRWATSSMNNRNLHGRDGLNGSFNF